MKQELETYRAQREMDLEEIKRLEREREDAIDWQGKTCEQIKRVLDTWEYEIDSNIIRELDSLKDLMMEGLGQMGEL